MSYDVRTSWRQHVVIKNIVKHQRFSTARALQGASLRTLIQIYKSDVPDRLSLPSGSSWDAICHQPDPDLQATMGGGAHNQRVKGNKIKKSIVQLQ